MKFNAGPTMTRMIIPVTLLILLSANNVANAGVITTLDFSTSDWNVGVTILGSALNNGSGVTLGGNGLRADRTGTAGGGIYVLVTLSGTISTVGYQNIKLEFVSDGSSTNRWDSTRVFGSTGDGFRISSSEGIDFETKGAHTAFETKLDASGTFWDTTTAAGMTPGPTDLQFSSAVDNSLITDLTFQLQVNDTNDFIRIRSVNITGDELTGVPEPSVLSFLTLLTGCFTIARRRSFPVEE